MAIFDGMYRYCFRIRTLLRIITTFTYYKLTMKRNILYLFIMAGVCLYGCTAKNDVLPNTPIPVSGTYSGQFKLYHVNPTTNAVRIDSANLSLVMETATGYKVAGDTSTLHAGSFGSYGVNSFTSEIIFVDKTFPTSGTPTKVHLSGNYAYEYDGSTLKLAAYGPLDTLQYIYKFTRTGN